MPLPWRLISWNCVSSSTESTCQLNPAGTVVPSVVEINHQSVTPISNSKALAERDFFPLFLDLALFLLVGITGSDATPTCLG
jgi:hypothetical protein